MNVKTIILIAKQFWINTLHSKGIYGLATVVILLICFSSYSGWKVYTIQNQLREHYQREVRESWENNPDKHPHRMAHYGSFAFRLKHPLSMFDFGLESYTGNAVFLEAHKQNTINFSEASLSSGLLRFGEISMAMLLQLILPLIIIFLGFSGISADRESGTVKVILAQGASWRELIVGRSAGLMMFPLITLIAVFGVTMFFLFVSDYSVELGLIARFLVTIISFTVFLWVVCVITITISATSSSSKDALLKLLGLWLVLAVILPRTTQALGGYLYPAPSKVVFETSVEEEVLRYGDSHNPDDPHYKHLRDSVLRAHAVASVDELPFNYSGFVMREGERVSTSIYNKHLMQLMAIYDQQNSLTKITAFINPFGAVRNVSMAMSGTDFESYKAFQRQSEAYRYRLAQTMNELQIELISNIRPGPNDKPHIISSDHWKQLPDFKHEPLSFSASFRNGLVSVIALAVWLIISILLIDRVSTNSKAI